jgi:hypothetical protein
MSRRWTNIWTGILPTRNLPGARPQRGLRFMLEMMDIFTHPLWFAPRIKSTKRRFLKPRHCQPANARRSPPARAWCDAQVTSLIGHAHPLGACIEVNPATSARSPTPNLEPPCSQAVGGVGTGTPQQPSRVHSRGTGFRIRMFTCFSRPSSPVIGISPFFNGRQGHCCSPSPPPFARDGGVLLSHQIIEVET